MSLRISSNSSNSIEEPEIIEQIPTSEIITRNNKQYKQQKTIVHNHYHQLPSSSNNNANTTEDMCCDLCCISEDAFTGIICYLFGFLFFPIWLCHYIIDRKSNKFETKFFAYLSLISFILMVLLLTGSFIISKLGLQHILQYINPYLLQFFNFMNELFKK